MEIKLCYMCKSDYRVDELDGVFVCHGFCRRDLLKSKEEQVDPEITEVKSEVNYKEGDHVVAVFSEDGVEYEGVILYVAQDDEGNKYGEVKYLGYGNQETVWLADIKPSYGEESRKQQIRESGAEQVPEKQEEPEKKPEVENVTAVKDWVEGDYVQFRDDDEVVCEGIITEVIRTSDPVYASVKKLGFADEFNCWLDDLIESAGKEARDLQMAQKTQQMVEEPAKVVPKPVEPAQIVPKPEEPAKIASKPEEPAKIVEKPEPFQQKPVVPEPKAITESQKPAQRVNEMKAEDLELKVALKAENSNLKKLIEALKNENAQLNKNVENSDGDSQIIQVAEANLRIAQQREINEKCKFDAFKCQSKIVIKDKDIEIEKLNKRNEFVVQDTKVVIAKLEDVKKRKQEEKENYEKQIEALRKEVESLKDNNSSVMSSASTIEVSRNSSIGNGVMSMMTPNQTGMMPMMAPNQGGMMPMMASNQGGMMPMMAGNQANGVMFFPMMPFMMNNSGVNIGEGGNTSSDSNNNDPPKIPTSTPRGPLRRPNEALNGNNK